jgi:hypothetical protein
MWGLITGELKCGRRCGYADRLEHAGQGPAATGEPKTFKNNLEWGRAGFKQLLLYEK